MLPLTMLQLLGKDVAVAALVMRYVPVGGVHENCACARRAAQRSTVVVGKKASIVDTRVSEKCHVSSFMKVVRCIALVSAGARIAAWACLRTSFVADEYWQTIEPAHRLAFG